MLVVPYLPVKTWGCQSPAASVDTWLTLSQLGGHTGCVLRGRQILTTMQVKGRRFSPMLKKLSREFMVLGRLRGFA